MNYIVALAIGAGIVVVFAWDQFNRPSYEASRELTRLVEILSPSRMRRRAVYWRAYAFYAGLLLLVYATLCAYGLLVGPTLGIKFPGYEEAEVGASALPATASSLTLEGTSGYDPAAIDALPQALAATPGGGSRDKGFRSDPTVPLFISLVIVGLAPTVPILQRIEAKLRFAAHRLSGIPTRLISGARELHARPLRLGAGTSNGLLIPADDWRRLRLYTRRAKGRLDDPLALYEDLCKIVAFRSWILQERLPLSNHADRDALAPVEARLAKAIEQLLIGLDKLAAIETPADEPEGERARAAWEASAREADQICADLCVLAMLYLEHGVLSDAEDAEVFAAARDESIDLARQRALAQQKLVAALRAAARSVDLETVSIVLWARATAATLLVALVYGTLLGADTARDAATSLSGGNHLKIGVLFMMSAALIYALALLVAITWQHNASQGNAWRNTFSEHWSRWTSQLAGVAFLSGLASAVCVVGYNIYATIGAVGFDKVIDNWTRVLGWAVAYEAPRAALGSALAICVVITIDAWRAGAAAGPWLNRMPWVSGAAMFAVGLGTRILTAQVAADAAGVPLALRSPELWQTALASGVLAGLIGLSAVLLVAATLIHEFPRAGGEPAPVARPAPAG